MKTLPLSGFKANPTQQNNITFGVTPEEELTLATRLAEKSVMIIPAERRFFGRTNLEDLARAELLTLRTIIDENKENPALQATLVKARRALGDLRNILGIKESEIPEN